MDVLIKNMEKPKACFTPLCKKFCYFHMTAWDGTGHYCQLTGNKLKCNNVDKDCTIVEVEPHGRLIDADRLRKVMEKAMANDSDKPLYKMMYSYVIRVLAESPTVLEANNGKVSD